MLYFVSTFKSQFARSAPLLFGVDAGKVKGLLGIREGDLRFSLAVNRGGCFLNAAL